MVQTNSNPDCWSSHKLLLSIVVPAYNCKKWINKLLESIDFSYHSYFEIYIIDDGSTESFYDEVKPWLDRFQCIKYFYKKNGNWGSVINYVKPLLNGCWIKIIDSDDQIVTGNFPRYLEYLQSEKVQKSDLVITPYLMRHLKSNFDTLNSFRLNKKGIILSSFDSFIFHFKIVTHHYLTIRNELFQTLIPLPEGYIYSADNCLVYQCIMRSKTIAFLPIDCPLYIYNVENPEQSTALNNIMRNKGKYVNVINDISSIPILNSVGHLRRKILYRFIRSMFYYAVLIFSLDYNSTDVEKKQEIGQLIDVLFKNMSKKVGKHILSSNPLIWLIYQKNVKIIVYVFRIVYRSMKKGMIKAIRESNV